MKKYCDLSVEETIENLKEIRDKICTSKYETETSQTLDCAIAYLELLNEKEWGEKYGRTGEKYTSYSWMNIHINAIGMSCIMEKSEWYCQERWYIYS